VDLFDGKIAINRKLDLILEEIFLVKKRSAKKSVKRSRRIFQ